MLYIDSLTTFELCLAKKSPYTFQLTAKLAAFYYSRGDVSKTIELMEKVVGQLGKC